MFLSLIFKGQIGSWFKLSALITEELGHYIPCRSWLAVCLRHWNSHSQCVFSFKLHRYVAVIQLLSVEVRGCVTGITKQKICPLGRIRTGVLLHLSNVMRCVRNRIVIHNDILCLHSLSLHVIPWLLTNSWMAANNLFIFFFFNWIILFLDQLVNHVDNAKEHSNRW